MKKQRTQEQIKFRFWFAITLIGAMVLTVILGKVKQANRPEPEKDMVTATMDRQLDSLIVDEFGPEAELKKTGDIQRMAKKSDEQNEKRYVKNMLDMELAKLEPNENKVKEYSDRLEKLQSRIDKQKKQYICYFRSILILLEDGTQWAGYQRMQDDLSRSDFTLLLERESDEQLEKTSQQLREGYEEIKQNKTTE